MEDIITALATAWGESGIAIVRISGESSVSLADKLFTAKKSLTCYPARELILGKLADKNGSIFDEILAARFEENGSYTGEESVEFQCHGGPASAQRCIEELCSLGARIAQPGEFTRRAFINGRIDLSRAEAVLGIIKAQSGEALLASARTLQGGFADEINSFLAELTRLAAQLEVDLDFPEEGESYMPKRQALKNMETLIKNGEGLLAKCRSGVLLREGIRVAILGRPNVGKSSLLNALLDEERAIVTAIPGTTRDRIEETFVHMGVPIRIIDTAGIRETHDEVESIGVTQSIKSMDEADLRIWVCDSGGTLTDEDIELGVRVSALPHLIVLNKTDLDMKTSANDIQKLFPHSRILKVSALRSEGIEELKDAVVETLSRGTAFTGSYGVTSRQMGCLISALDSLNEARNAAEKDLGDDIVLACLSEARAQLAALLGIDATEELLDTVFSSFCVGK